MAGRGSRLRPHTLTVPKPLIPVAGKPIVQRLVEDIAELLKEPIEEIWFVTGDFGEEVKQNLLQIAQSLGSKGFVVEQEQPLGTAHAIYCAKEALEGNVVVAFADTLFRADFDLDTQSDGVVWVKQVDNPSAFGVVKLDDQGIITDFEEKPKHFVSDLAIIGIYYFKQGENLRSEIEYLLDNDIREKEEYQLTNALENMKQKGAKFSAGKVEDWMDCGNKNATVETNAKILEYEKDTLSEQNHDFAENNSLIIEPCYIGEGVEIINSKVGPYVSIGDKTKVMNSNITYSLIQSETVIKDSNLDNSMIGNHTHYVGVSRSISIGDYSDFDFKDSND